MSRRQLILPLAVSTLALLLPRSANPRSLNQPLFDKNRVYQNFLTMADRKTNGLPILLSQGINHSPISPQVDNYPQFLKEKLIKSTSQKDNSYHNYPDLGNIPFIDESGLDFFDEEITEACLCIGRFSQGIFTTKWLGRNALKNEEFWSATKFIPLLYLFSRDRLQGENINLKNCEVRGLNKDNQLIHFPLLELAKDVINYQKKYATSNSIGATFKRFQTQIELEKWVKNITGNHRLIFRGRYGEEPLITQPELYNISQKKVIIKSDIEPLEWGDNYVSAYDLTRLISLIGWHYYLPQKAKIPQINTNNLDNLIKILGLDTARLTDLGIKTLELDSHIDSLVIISKQGYGTSKIRERSEGVYVALIGFIYQEKLFTIAMTLKAAYASQPRDIGKEMRQIDARLATEVTAILEQLVNMRL